MKSGSDLIKNVINQGGGFPKDDITNKDLFSKSDDKGGGGQKSEKMMTSFMNCPLGMACCSRFMFVSHFSFSSHPSHFFVKYEEAKVGPLCKF